MGKIDFADKLVVVTGASSGLGREIARRLAYREGAHLVIAARRRGRLEDLKAEIEAGSASRVHVVAVDLAAPDGAETLFRQATATGPVFGLVNCAGVTFYGRTLEAPEEMNRGIVAVNLVASITLTMLFLRDMLDRGGGAILAVTSIVGYVSAPFQNIYAATKHGLQSFMEGLAREYRGKGVALCTFAPGGMATEMNTNSGLDKKFAEDNPFNMDPAKAARIALKAFKRGRVLCVPGALYRIAVVFARLAPRSMVSWAMDRLYAP